MNAEIMTGQICPYCLQPTNLIDSIHIYGKSYGMVWACLPCDAWVGVHDGSTRALGRLANKPLREAKRQVHAYLDILWDVKITRDHCSKREARDAAYEWLASEMKIPRDDTHIGLFDIEQCKQAIEICKQLFKKATDER